MNPRYLCRTERSYGFFRRAIPLPSEVDSTKAEARLDKGVLTIKLPKTESAKKQSVRVTVKS
jgi:HSP20 family protein